MKKKIHLKTIIITVVVLLILFAGIPLILEHLIFRNNVYSVLTNGEWGSFLGSYIGGIVGGAGTLIAMYVTTKETRKVQDENLNQLNADRSLEDKKERKKFADKIAEDVSVYITDINNYFYACRFGERLYDKDQSLNQELHSVEHKIENIHIKLKKLSIVNDSETEEYLSAQNELEELKQKESELRYRIERNSKEMEQNKADRTIANERYFLLKIKLQNIESGKKLLEQLKFIHDNSANVKGTDLDFISKETDRLLNITVEFVDRYVNQNT